MSERTFYRHYKSPDPQRIVGCYEVLGIARHTNTDEDHTVYRPCCMGAFELMNYIRPTHEFDGYVGSIRRFEPITDPDLIKRLILATDLLYGK